MPNKKSKNVIFATLLVLAILSSLIYYFNYNMRVMQQDYNIKILKLNEDVSSKLSDLEAKISALSSNLSIQIGIIDDSLQNSKKQNQQEIATLANLIDQIEKQSNIRLSELKDELKNIRIKSADFSAIIDEVLQSVVSIRVNLEQGRVGQGSGAIINKIGYIVTNLHVINGASAVRVTTYDGKTFNADVVVGQDSSADIAVLRINAPNLRALNFGNSEETKVGEKVIAAGNPAGLSFTVTEGIISAFRTAQNNIKYIQTDVPINPGNSGGPLINTKGEIIGINNFKVGGFEGLGFAIASNNVKSVVEKIIEEYEAKQKQ